MEFRYSTCRHQLILTFARFLSNLNLSLYIPYFPPDRLVACFLLTDDRSSSILTATDRDWIKRRKYRLSNEANNVYCIRLEREKIRLIPRMRICNKLLSFSLRITEEKFARKRNFFFMKTSFEDRREFRIRLSINSVVDTFAVKFARVSSTLTLNRGRCQGYDPWE